MPDQQNGKHAEYTKESNRNFANTIEPEGASGSMSIRSGAANYLQRRFYIVQIIEAGLL
jgi:hypothetical protein